MGFARQVSARGTNIIKTHESSENYRGIIRESLRVTFTVCEFRNVYLVRAIPYVCFRVKRARSEISFVQFVSNSCHVLGTIERRISNDLQHQGIVSELSQHANICI